jgi:hypothetical protein
MGLSFKPEIYFWAISFDKYELFSPLPPILFKKKIKSPPNLGDLGG